MLFGKLCKKEIVRDYEKVPLLPASNERNVLKVLDVKRVEHKGQKRKLLLTEDGTTKSNDRSWKIL